MTKLEKKKKKNIGLSPSKIATKSEKELLPPSKGLSLENIIEISNKKLVLISY
jgi:hypothetical protein